MESHQRNEFRDPIQPKKTTKFIPYIGHGSLAIWNDGTIQYRPDIEPNSPLAKYGVLAKDE